jgi:hypothetical protein
MKGANRLALMKHIQERRKAGQAVVTETGPTYQPRAGTTELFDKGWWCAFCNAHHKAQRLCRCRVCGKQRRYHDQAFAGVYGRPRRIS